MPVTGSYDPNDKLASPKGVTAQGLIRKGQWIDYKIRFQNTGTDTAFTVRLIDTLDTRLEITSLEFGAASHPYTWSLIHQDPPVFEAVFSNILLPDSNVNEPASHGFLNFLIKANDTLVQGTEIKNFADIYFDFNPPIRTNTVLHTISDFLPVASPDTTRLQPCSPQAVTYEFLSDTVLCEDQVAALFEEVPSGALVRYQILENNAWGPYLDVSDMRALNPETYFVRQLLFVCDGPQDQLFTLEINPTPDAPVLALVNDTLRAASFFEGTTEWFIGDSLIASGEGVYVPAEEGLYRARITTPEGCVSGFSEEVFFKPRPLNIEAISGLTVFGGPNPASDVFVLNIKADYPKTTRIYFTDMMGRVISPAYSLKSPEPFQRIELPLTGLSEGVYLLRVEDGIQEVTLRVMVLK